MPGPVVAGLDGSRESMAAAHWAAREALRRGMPLRLHASAGPPDDEAEAEVGPLPGRRAPRGDPRRMLLRAVDRIEERHPQLGIAAEHMRAEPCPALPAAEDGAELLVIGSRGQGAVSDSPPGPSPWRPPRTPAVRSPSYGWVGRRNTNTCRTRRGGRRPARRTAMSRSP